MQITPAGESYLSGLSNNGTHVVREVTNNNLKIKHMTLSTAVLNSILFAFLGIAILVIAFVIIEVLTPKHNIRREILEKQNMALAVLAGAFMLSIAIIIASAIH